MAQGPHWLETVLRSQHVLTRYAALGIDSFVLSGYPHLEEAYKVGELLFPHLDVAIPEIPQPQRLQQQGEAVANEFIPRKVAQS